MSGSGVPFGTADGEARVWLDAHVSRVAPLLRDANLAEWEAATAGTDAAAERVTHARLAWKRVYADRDEAAQIRTWLEDPDIADPLLRRQLILLEHEYVANALPPETLQDLTRRAAALEQTFHTFRARIDGDPVTENEIRDVLRSDRDAARRRCAWEASKQVAREVAEPLRELVRRRNAAARELGFGDFYSMSLYLQELDEERLFKLLDQFRDATDAPFRLLRDEQDRDLAARFGLEPHQLRPWHWADPFGQETSPSASVDLDRFFVDSDTVGIATRFFRLIGMPVEETLARSDLYERAGKDQHAFCTDIDREGDVRVLCNLRPTEHWMSTLLHELGHAVYDTELPRDLPWVLRTPAHILSTEAVAMMMGRLTRTPEWLREVVGADINPTEETAVRAELRSGMLVAARWMLVMIFFERELYRNPDRADLNRLWWDLVERLQMIRRPDGRDEPDWAAKIHLSAAPAYYHNYLLGEWMSSQLRAAMGSQPDGGWTAAGDFLRDHVFSAGASDHWDAVLERATGECLSPRFFVEEFVTG